MRLSISGHCSMCVQHWKNVQACMENMAHDIFFVGWIQPWPHFWIMKNGYTWGWCVYHQSFDLWLRLYALYEEGVEKIGGYKFVQWDEWEGPNQRFKDELPLKKEVWGQQVMQCYGAVKNNFPINAFWEQKNMMKPQFYPLNYQHFNEITQQPDMESKIE